MELFFCHVPGNAMREKWSARCIDRWDKEGVSEGHFLTPEYLQCSNYEFQKRRREYAEHMAKGEFYILADDDCLPPDNPKGVLSVTLQARAIMHSHPEYGMLSFMPANATIVEWTPEDYKTANDSQVMEHHSVGGLRIVRKGAIKNWPEQTLPSYDTEHCQAMRDAGYRVGYFRKLKMMHLGEGKSSIWPR
jgi:hypothetical protein